MEKNFYRIFLLIAVCYILFLRTCSGGKPCKPLTIVQTKTDTVYLDVFQSTGWLKPEPDTVIKWQYDTIEIPGMSPLEFDSARLVKMYKQLYADFKEKSYYEQTQGSTYGDITTMDSVYDNRLMAHKVVTNFHLPVVTTTNTVIQKPVSQVYAGFGVFGGNTDLIKGFELSLALKNKKDDMYELGGLMLNDGHLYLKAGMKFKLSLRKK